MSELGFNVPTTARSFGDRMLFFLPIKVEMPTIVGISSLMSKKNSCSAEVNMKIVL